LVPPRAPRMGLSKEKNEKNKSRRQAGPEPAKAEQVE
jgi:hypothetical protein